jgi:hypothetical protein
MGFKLGREIRQHRNSTNTPIVRKKLDKGILGEANMDGSIFINEDVKPNSAQEKAIIAHEQIHAKEMAKGKLSYTDTTVTDEIADVEYKRDNGDLVVTQSSKKNIKKGDRFKEGSKKLPHEQRAYKNTKV